jgi:hypothetical protein
MAQCMAMGQAAATAAVIATETNCFPSEIDRSRLRDRLLATGAILEWPSTLMATT